VLRKIFAISLIALLCSSCTAAQIVQVIDAAVTIGEEAAAAAGVNISLAYSAYVSAALNCISFAATEEGSSDPASTKYTQITAKCAQYASVALPPGTAQNLVNMAAKLALSIEGILAKLPKPAPLTARASPTGPVLKPADVQKLHALAQRAEAASRKAKPGP
jgi:hypothetical protein